MDHVRPSRHHLAAASCARLAGAALLFVPAVVADDWPAWRGPDALGVADTQPLDLEAGDPFQPIWTAELAGESTSTPVLWADRLYVTSQIGDSAIETRGRDAEVPAPPDDGEIVFAVEALGRATGERLWKREIPARGELQPVHMKHNLASPSPVTDGERLVVWFGNGQIAALDLDGEVLWERHLGEEIAPFEIRWAHGSSPVIYRDTVVLLCDHAPASYLLALDLATGETRWKIDRGEGRRSYATPLVIRHDGRDQLVVNSDLRIDAYDAATGEPLWHVGQPARVPVSSPVYSEGVLYTSRGYRSGPYMAVRLGGSGDLSDGILWRHPTGAPYVSSILYQDGLVYMATETGVASAVDARTGETVWKERLGGNFSASPIVAGDHVYLLNEEGELFVIRTGRKYELLAQTEIGERTLATPVISDGQLFVRGDRHLHVFGQRTD